MENGVCACKPESFLDSSSSIINFDAVSNESAVAVCRKLENHTVPLEEIAWVKSGIKAYEVGKGSPPMTKQDKDSRIYHSNTALNVDYKKYLDGVDVGRYRLGWSGQYVQYGKNLAAPRKTEFFFGERILVRQIPSRPPYSVNASYVDEHCINDLNSMIVIKQENDYDLKYILAILNSKLISFWFNMKFGKLQRKLFPQFKVNELARFPICEIDFGKKDEKRIHDRLVKLADQMLTAQAKRQGSTSESDGKLAEQRISILDRQIDALVYELYGLTDEEIGIVEGCKEQAK